MRKVNIKELLISIPLIISIISYNPIYALASRDNSEESLSSGIVYERVPEEVLSAAKQTSVVEVTEEDSQDPARESVNFTQDELILAAKTVYHEAANQGVDGQVAVAEVIYNRVRSPLFPNTVTEVIYQKNQFEGAGDIALCPVDETILNIVNAVFSGESSILNNEDAMYFRNPGKKGEANWGRYTFYRRINDHCFYLQAY